VDAIEISLGPAGALYGSDAVGGVAQVFTRSPRPAQLESFEVHGRALYRYGSADRSSQGRLAASLTRGDALGMLLGVSAKTFGDLEAGRRVGRQRNTGFDEYDLDFKLLLQPHPDHEFSLLYQHVTQDDVPRTHRTVFAVPFKGTTVGSELKRDLDQRRDLLALQLRSEPELSFLDRAYLGLSWQRPREKRDRVRGDGRRDISETIVDTIGAFAQLDSDTRWGNWIYGFEYYHDFVDSSRDNYAADGSFTGSAIQGPVGDDSRYGLLGVYAQWSKFVLPSVEVILGGRFTYAFADADRVADPQTGLPVSLDDDWTDFSGSLRALWRARDWLRLYAGVNQGFRAPNLSDLTRLDTARSNEIQTPSTDLDPEEFIAVELGAKTHWDRASGSVSLFYTWIDDGLIRTPTGRTIDGEQEVQVTNVGDGFVTGVEAAAEIEVVADWSLFGNVAYLYGKQDTFPTSSQDASREWIDRMMPLNGAAGLRWNSQPDPFWAEISMRWFAAQHKLSPRDSSDTQRIPPGGTPSWVTLNLYAGLNLGEHFSLGMALENLTDETYRVHGSGVTAPGFSAMITTEFRY
jgi:hemoglobin/transferrin/lactoferrin receptor protein